MFFTPSSLLLDTGSIPGFAIFVVNAARKCDHHLLINMSDGLLKVKHGLDLTLKSSTSGKENERTFCYIWLVLTRHYVCGILFTLHNAEPTV